MLNWGVLSAGRIAHVFCNAMRFTDTGQILAVASRTQSKADRLVNDFGIPRQYRSYEDLLEDEEIDAVYIATIHPLHAEWAIKCAKARKHILVEKPISMNYAETVAMVEAARENDVFLMEAFIYRCHPQMQQVVKLIQDGAIGEIHVIRATISYRLNFDSQSRIYNQEAGGGSILDIGCYAASMVRRIAGAAENKPFLHHDMVKGNGKLGPTGVDHIAAATLRFENDIIAEIIAAVDCNLGSRVSIFGSDGTMTIANPWLQSLSPCIDAEQPLPLDTIFPSTKIVVQSYQNAAGRWSISTAGESSEITVDVDRDPFTYGADTVANHIRDREAPAMSWDDSLSNMRLLDAWRAEVGVVY